MTQGVEVTEGVEVTQGPASSPSHRTRLAIFVAAGLVVVLVASYLGAFAWVGGGIPRGTTVAGVDIGGMSQAEAVTALDEALGERSEAMLIDLQGRPRDLKASKLGLSFNASATVAAVPMRETAPQALLGQVAGQDIDPVVDVDQQRLDRVVRTLAKKIDDPVRQARIEYDDSGVSGVSEVVVISPRAGSELDRTAAAAAILDNYLVSDEPVEFSAVPVLPYASEDEAQEFGNTEATEAISASIELEFGGKAVEVKPDQIASVLSYRSKADGMTAKVDAELLRELVAGPLSRVGTPVRDATFDVSSGTPKVVPARTGRGVDDDALSAGVVTALQSDERTVELDLERVDPELTTAEAKDLGVTEQIATFTQAFPYAEYRVTNIGLASEKINGTILEPGETFSLNGVVGERTPENGFVEGFVISGGRLIEDYGGAVSTITTAMWHTAFYAGMTRIEQRAHGYWISRYIAGLEATVSWGYLDLKFRNDTPYGVFITSSLTDSSVTTTMWSTKYWDIKAEFGSRENYTTPGTVYDSSDDCVPQTGVAGFDITVTRVWSRNGDVERREELPTDYDAADTVICAPEPSEEPTDKQDEKPSDKPSDDETEKPGGSGGGGNGGSGGNN